MGFPHDAIPRLSRRTSHKMLCLIEQAILSKDDFYKIADDCLLKNHTHVVEIIYIMNKNVLPFVIVCIYNPM